MARLNTDLIAAAACQVLDERGTSGFTMRAVSDALKVTPMALYNHVHDKAELAALVVDAVIDRHPLPTPTGDWQADLWSIARWMREGTIRHPALQEVLRAQRIWTPRLSEVAERWYGIWQQSGLTNDQAMPAAFTSGLAISGLVERESRYYDEYSQPKIGSKQKTRAFCLAEYDHATLFELTARSIIQGLHAQLSKPLNSQRARLRRQEDRSAFSDVAR